MEYTGGLCHRCADYAIAPPQCPGWGLLSSGGQSAVPTSAGAAALARAELCNRTRGKLRYCLAFFWPGDLDMHIVVCQIIEPAPMISLHSWRQGRHPDVLALGHNGTERLHRSTTALR